MEATKHSEEEMQKYRETYQKAVEIEKNFDKLASESLVLRRYSVLQFYRQTLPAYENIPEDVRQSFNFDIRGLTQRLNTIMK